MTLWETGIWETGLQSPALPPHRSCKIWELLSHPERERMQSWFGGLSQAPNTTCTQIRGSVGLESTGGNTASQAPAPLCTADITNGLQHTSP